MFVEFGTGQRGRNRYIVECKEGTEELYQRVDEVEIDTLWNVKYDRLQSYVLTFIVEIDTLWNVKADAYGHVVVRNE